MRAKSRTGKFAAVVAALTVAATVALVSVSADRAAAADPKGKVVIPEKAKFHIYILMGQSNMSGRGQIYLEDRTLNQRLLTLGKENAWKPAAEPLHWDKPPGIAGVGPGRAFAEAMLAESDEGVSIGVVPCAETGSELLRWEKTGDLYARAVQRARRAMKDGELKGILWQHGETDSASYTSAVNYGVRLRETIVQLRKDLGQGDVPFVVGELSPLLPGDRFPAMEMVNKGLKELPKELRACDVVPVKGLNMMADQVHFDAQSARVLGRRFATTMKEVQKKAAKR